MDKKANRKRPAQFKRVAVDDIMNINESAPKKRKQVAPHLRPAVLKTLKLKAEPTQLFSQFKPKENQDTETTSETRAIVENYCSPPTNTAKESSKVGLSKGWTPPIKNAAPQKNSEISSPGFQKISVLKDFNNIRVIGISGASEKSKNVLANQKSKISSVNSVTNSQNSGFAGMNDGRKSFNAGSQGGREEGYFKPNTTAGSKSYTGMNQTGIQSLLDAIGVIEGNNTEHNVEIKNHNNTDSLKHEAGELRGVEKQVVEEKCEQIRSTVISSNELSVFEPTPNVEGNVYIETFIDKESYEFDTQPIEQLAEKNSSQHDDSTELIDLTNESQEVVSRSQETTEEPIIEEIDERPLTSSPIEYTKVYGIVNVKSPVVCTVIKEVRNTTEGFKVFDFGSENENNSEQADSVGEIPIDKHNMGFDKVDLNDVTDDRIAQNDSSELIDQTVEADDEKIMKEVSNFVYDSLKLSQKQDENSNLIELETADRVSQTKFQNRENDSILNVSYDFGYVEETEIGDGSINVDAEDEALRDLQITNKKDDDSYQLVRNEKFEDKEVTIMDEEQMDERFVNKVEIFEKSREPIMDVDQKNDEHATEQMSGEYDAGKLSGENDEQGDKNEKEGLKSLEKNGKYGENNEQGDENEKGLKSRVENDKDNENNEQEDNNAKEGLKSRVENDKDELWNGVDDAFDEVIDVSSTQLIDIENEYANEMENLDNTDTQINETTNSNQGTAQVSGNNSTGSYQAVFIPAVPALVIPTAPALEWLDRHTEHMQRFRALVQEIAQLNATIAQMRNKMWPK